ADSLELVADIPATERGDGKRSKVVGLEDAPGNRFVFSLYDTDPDEGPHQGEINLKRNALLPIVEAVRLYALREGVAATNTQDRIAALANKGVFSRDERAALSGAFDHVAELLLRGQIADTLAGRKPSAYVAPDALPGHDKDILALAMKAVDRLNTRLRADFTGGIL
ncbi:MAG: hypothetical protein HQL41_12785, partial [Alphaproteobacteria bacterium]|nr:hypothetical protein [Alphaproteobacteria bacterium]